MGELAGLAGAGGVFGILATVIGLLLRAMHRDRQQYEEAIDRAEKRADAAEARAVAAWARLDEARDRRGGERT